MTNWVAKYIGAEYGETRGRYTCWSLIAAVYAERLGIDLKGFGGIDLDIEGLLRIGRGEESQPSWVQVRDPQEYDVVIMNSHIVKHNLAIRAPTHAGLVVQGKLLHIEQGRGATFVPLDHPLIVRRIMAYCRYEGVGTHVA